MPSPQADNWLRKINAIHETYSIFIVPSQLKPGFVRFLDRITQKKNYRVASHRFHAKTLQKMLHLDRYDALQAERNRMIRRYPQIKDLFNGLQYVIYMKSNNRPFTREFKEDEFLAKVEKFVATAPLGPNSYATAVRYNIGNGVVTSLPILTFNIHESLMPVSMLAI